MHPQIKQCIENLSSVFSEQIARYDMGEDYSLYLKVCGYIDIVIYAVFMSFIQVPLFPGVLF